jgi:hypothetical protein
MNVERRAGLNKFPRKFQGFFQNIGPKALLLAMIWK